MRRKEKSLIKEGFVVYNPLDYLSVREKYAGTIPFASMVEFFDDLLFCSKISCNFRGNQVVLSFLTDDFVIPNFTRYEFFDRLFGEGNYAYIEDFCGYATCSVSFGRFVYCLLALR